MEEAAAGSHGSAVTFGVTGRLLKRKKTKAATILQCTAATELPLQSEKHKQYI